MSSGSLIIHRRRYRYRGGSDDSEPVPAAAASAAARGRYPTNTGRRPPVVAVGPFATRVLS